jgi:hypothetical protein
MPRTSRMIVPDEKAVYHVMSRTALDGFPLADVEKDFMLDLIVGIGTGTYLTFPLIWSKVQERCKQDQKTLYLQRDD